MLGRQRDVRERIRLPGGREWWLSRVLETRLLILGESKALRPNRCSGIVSPTPIWDVPVSRLKERLIGLSPHDRFEAPHQLHFGRPGLHPNLRMSLMWALA